MCPEFGGTVGFFAVDANAIEYLRQTSKIRNQLKNIFKPKISFQIAAKRKSELWSNI